MSRTEYFASPDAPRPTRIVPSASCFVLDEGKALLVIRRTDNGLWSLPGGAQEIGESLIQTATRECLEETGIRMEVTGLVGIYTDPRRIIAFDDGEVRQEFSVCFRGNAPARTVRVSSESSDVQWFTHNELADLDIEPAIRMRIEHGYSEESSPYLG